MKKLFVFLVLLIALESSVFAQHRHRHPRVYVRPVVRVAIAPPPRAVCPSPNHIWIDGEYYWDDRAGDFYPQPGYWAVPPSRHSYWIPGYWVENRHRNRKWISGYWARR